VFFEIALRFQKTLHYRIVWPAPARAAFLIIRFLVRAMKSIALADYHFAWPPKATAYETPNDLSKMKIKLRTDVS
jgi:hypothetical protein